MAKPLPVVTADIYTTLPQDDNSEVSLLDLLKVVFDNLRLLVLGPLAVGLVALGITFAIAPTFSATTKFLPPQQQQSSASALLSSLGALGGLAGAASGLKSPADQYIAFLKSRSIQDALIERFNLVERYSADLADDARLGLEANIKISSGKDGLITIVASDYNPAFAAQLANAHLEELSKLLSRLAITEAQQRRQFFEKQLASAKENLIKAEQALKSSGVNSSALKASPVAAVEGLAKLKAAITAQEIKVASMRGYLTEAAPDFKQAQTELTAMRSQMVRAEKEEPANSGSSGRESDYIAKFRDFKYHETLFELFAKQYEMARVDESREGAVIQVLDVAKPPQRKAKPEKALIAMVATLAAGFALLLFVFIRQAVRAAIQQPGTSEKMLALSQALSKALSRRDQAVYLRPKD